MVPARSHPYVPLNHKAAEIRLVTFERIKDGAIRGRLHVYPMSECPAYIAISYTWGDEPSRRTIYLSGTQFQHRENIYQAMKSILRLRARTKHGAHPLQRTLRQQGLSRRTAECEFFWIDSTCVDQVSLAEKNHQVSMMGQIFSNAEFLIAWLGPEGNRNVEIMQAISDYEPSHESVPLSFAGRSVPRHLGDMLDIFASLNYWSRLWIVQEIILARDSLVSWGNEFLPWYKITNVGLNYSSSPLVRFESFEHSHQFANEYEEGWVRLVMERSRRELFLKNPGGSAGDPRSMKPASLYALLVQFAGNRCLIPRDKVIGLLGLIPDDAARLADYSIPDEEYSYEICKYALKNAFMKYASMHLPQHK